MRFWDSSAVVPLFIEQPATELVQPLIDEVPDAVIWWGTSVECASAISRLRREGAHGVEEETEVLTFLEEWRETCVEVQPSERIRRGAVRLLRIHALRAADSLQLAAALAWAGTPEGHVLVTLDDRLGEAARLEGFHVVPSSGNQ
jgi:hypothetical protein